LKLDSAESGFAAIEKVKNGNVYDIIFMDYMMPKMDGVETTKILREMGYTNPIVALTANAVAGQAEIFLESGFDDFISKPIDIRYLNIVLNKLVRDKQPPEVVEAARKQTGPGYELIIGSAQQLSISSHIAGVFVRDAQKSLDALDMLIEKGAPYSEEDIQTYTTHIHGMKGALANIGKTELSAIALKLERAGRDSDVKVITAETPAFLDALRVFINELEVLEKTADDDKADGDMSCLKEHLLAMKTACEEYDKNTANEVLKELRQTSWPQQIKELLTIISEQLLHSDFDNIVDDIEKYMNTL
jgi:CheY-like chemotaxis protein